MTSLHVLRLKYTFLSFKMFMFYDYFLGSTFSDILSSFLIIINVGNKFSIAYCDCV